MSDGDPVLPLGVPSPPDPVPPPAAPAGPPGPRTMRPPTRKAAPPPRAPSKVKAYLVIGIIVTSVLLIAAIGWRLYVRVNREPVVTRNLSAEWDVAYSKAKAAWEELFKIEAKVWIEGRELTPEELAKIKGALTVFQQTSDKFHELNDLALREQKKHDMGEQLPLLKTWLWDANGVLDPASKPPRYGGLYIPMYQAEKRRDQAVMKLAELKTRAPEIVAKGDPAEIEAGIKEARRLIDEFAAIRDEFLQLDDDLLKGITLPDLKKEQLKDLEELRDFQSKASMGIKEAREVRSQFPAVDQSLPPKQEPPKEEPPKETPKDQPPKEDPPKEQPPKEQPPKEEPPKEQPK